MASLWHYISKSPGGHLGGVSSEHTLSYFISRHPRPERSQRVSAQALRLEYIILCPFTWQHLPDNLSALILLASHLVWSPRPGTFLSYRGDALSCLVRRYAKMAGLLTTACFSWGLSLPALKIARAFEVTRAFLLYRNYRVLPASTLSPQTLKCGLCWALTSPAKLKWAGKQDQVQ